MKITENSEKNNLTRSLIDFFNFFLQKYQHLNSLEFLSPKFKLLMKIILEKFSKNDQQKSKMNEMLSIIFVNKRIIAKYLRTVLSLYCKKTKNNHLQSDYIIGHHTIYSRGKSRQNEFVKKVDNIDNLEEIDILKEVYERNMDSTNVIVNSSFFSLKYKLFDQLNIINEFKSGKINVLISTSVVEEGFDIPDCNLVVSYSEPQTIKSFIQLKGRTRKDQSDYIILCPSAQVHKKKILILNKKKIGNNK